MFWFTAILLICIAAALPVAALLRKGGAEDPEAAAAEDVQFYRSQLLAIEKDVARAVISAGEAQGAKVEISRRLLEADRRAAENTGHNGLSGGRPVVALLIAVAIFATTAALYFELGARGQTDRPLAARLADAEELRLNRPSQTEAEASVPERVLERNPDHVALVVRLREALETRPDDLQGHILLAGNEARLGNFSEAARAQINVIRIKKDEAEANDYADLADLMILAAGGYVSPEAETALHAALDRDPQNGAARYYMGLMFAQTGRADVAFSFWRPLLEQSPSDAPWIPAIRAEIMTAAQLAGVRYELPPETAAPGPSQRDIDAASEMSSEDRAAMIAGMVAGLDARLTQEGGSAEEWVRLILARAQLGEAEAAREATERAREDLAGNAQALAAIEEAARQAGLTGAGE